MSRSLLLSLISVGAAACGYSGREIGTDASGDDDIVDGAPGADARADAVPAPDANPGDPDAALPVDSDGDTVPDALDNCPDTANGDQRNEDGDDRGNACDLCPHKPGTVPGTDADSDGDGIGNQCDPRTGTDRLVVFLGFDQTSDFGGFEVREGVGSWTVGGGALHLVTSSATESQQVVWTTESLAGTVMVETKVHVDSVPSPGTAGTRLASAIGGYWDTTSPIDAYACGLRGASANGAATVAAWHYVDPPGVDVVQTNPFGGTLSAGAEAAVRLVARDNGAADSTLDCAADAATVAATVPDYVPSGMPGLRTVGTTASFEYLFVVEVGP